MHLFTSENRLRNATIDSASHENSTRFGCVGTVCREVVYVSPLRYVNKAACSGAREEKFRNTKTIVWCLAQAANSSLSIKGVTGMCCQL